MPPSLNVFLPYGLLFLALSTLTRLGLAFFTGTPDLPVVLWPDMLLRGLGFDLVVLAWLLSPALLWSALVPNRWRHTRLRIPLRHLLFFLVSCALLFTALAEATFWIEFFSRFNFIAVDYLIYTHEVIGNIRESYPVGFLLAGVGLTAFILTWIFRRKIARVEKHFMRVSDRLMLAGLAFLLPFVTWHVVDIDQMKFSANSYANEIAGNGLMTLAAALRRNELNYERFYATMPPTEAIELLEKLGVEREVLSEALTPDPDESEVFDSTRLPFKRPPKNIVLITVESLSARFLGVLGNDEGLTPRLDALASEGLLFTHLYATGTRTVRGLEALTLGTPPIPGQAIVRRPGNEHLATLGEILRRQGFETLFIYGGYGYFDNMNAYFAGNDYRVVDRTDFPKASVGFENIWGVADEYLFDNALTQLDRTHAGGKPFLAQIMTTSNHRPFTYPAERIDIPSPGGRNGGVKYTDYAIGRFIDQAKQKPWFADTLFVIVADHCASAAGKSRLPVPGYHIPAIFYAPALLAPGRFERLASQIDLPPTLIDILGVNGDDHFFGKSVFEQKPGEERAFISNYQELGYLKGNQLIVLGPKQRIDAYTLDTAGEALPAPANKQLSDEAIAYYQTAYLAFKQGALRLK